MRLNTWIVNALLSLVVLLAAGGCGPEVPSGVEPVARAWPWALPDTVRIYADDACDGLEEVSAFHSRWLEKHDYMTLETELAYDTVSSYRERHGEMRILECEQGGHMYLPQWRYYVRVP